MQHKINILLIEDNKTDQWTISKLLEGTKLRYNLLKADTLLDGLEFLINSSVDVILLDLGLPDSNGYKTLQRIIEKNYLIPIIVLTVTQNSIIESLAIKAGAQEYLTKDKLNQSILLKAIQNSYLRNSIVKKLISQNDELNSKLKNQTEAWALTGSAFWSMDLVTNEMQWSKELFEMFNFKVDSVNPSLSLYLKYVHPEEKEQVNKWFGNVPASYSSQELIHRVIIGKSIIKIRLIARFCIDRKAHPLRIIGTIQQIKTDAASEAKPIDEGLTESNISQFIESLIQNIEFSMKQVQLIHLDAENTLIPDTPPGIIEKFHVSMKVLNDTMNWLKGIMLLSGFRESNSGTLISIKSLIRKTEKHLGYKMLEHSSLDEHLTNLQVEYSPPIWEVLLKALNNWLTQIESHNQKILEMTVFQKNNEAKLSFTANLTNVRADFIKKTASGIENQRDLKLTSMFNEASMTVNEYAVLIYNITKWMGGTMNLIRNEAERIVEINIPLRINILQSNKTTNHRNISDNYKILIADDHFLTRLSTKKNIKSILGDIMIDEAENGEQAIMKAEKEKYDLILMDIEMPGMDGKESMLEIKKIYNPNIIALVHEDAEAKQELIFEGFAGVLKKPIRTEELTEVINRQSQNLLSYYE